MSDTVGSVKSVTIEGQSFNVAADVNATFTPTSHEKSKLATSGKAMTKSVKRVQLLEGLVLLINGSDLEALKFYVEADSDKQVIVTLASEDSYQALAEINLEGYETEEGRATISVHPSEEWTAFIA